METLEAEFIPPQTAITQRPSTAMGGLEISVSAALEAQVRANIEARYALAVGHPRDLDLVRQRILKECKRPGLAEVAMYVKPVGKSRITGLSIRFAEMAQRNMGNIAAESMVIYEDRTQRIVRMTVTDVESNVPLSVDVPIAKTVERSNGKDREVLGVRQNAAGNMVYVVACTEDELLVKQNSHLAKAKRNLVLALVPGDIIDEAKQVIIDTQRSKDKAEPDTQRKKVFDAFAEIGITPPEIKEYLGREAGPADLVELRGLYQALRQGEVRWRDLLDEKRSGESGDASKTLTETLAAKAKAKTAAAPVGPPQRNFIGDLASAPTRVEVERIYEDARATLVGDDLESVKNAYDRRVVELRAGQ